MPMGLLQTAGEYGGGNSESFLTTVASALDNVIDLAGQHWGLVAGVAIGLVVIGALVLRGRKR